MRDPKRIHEVLFRLQKIWEKSPDLRLGQLILNAIPDPPLYYISDEDLVDNIRRFYERPL